MPVSVRLQIPVFALALFTLAACDASGPAASGNPPSATAHSKQSGPADLTKLPAGAIVLRRVLIEDRGVIHRGPAMSALIPAGWQAQGGVVGPQSGCSEPFLVDWTATSPDGRSALGIFPTEAWRWSTFPMQTPCPEAVLRTARDYLQSRATRAFPGARPLDYRDRPDFAQSAAENAQRLLNMAQGMGLSDMRAYAEGGELLFAFQRDGVEMRGVMGVTAVFQGTVGRNPLDGSRMEQFVGSTLGTFMAVAPEGELDFDLVEASRRSIVPDAAWLQRLFALQAELGQMNAQATRERAAIIVAGGAEATRRNIAHFEQMARNSVKNSQDSVAASQRSVAAAQRSAPREIFPGDAAGDRMQRESVEGIRGVETYHDPVDGRNVQLDANYEHAWRVNNQDAYILTRDPNFNPGAYGIEATQMGVVK